MLQALQLFLPKMGPAEQRKRNQTQAQPSGPNTAVAPGLQARRVKEFDHRGNSIAACSSSAVWRAAATCV
jgi:hypothetical protein